MVNILLLVMIIRYRIKKVTNVDSFLNKTSIVIKFESFLIKNILNRKAFKTYLALIPH